MFNLYDNVKHRITKNSDFFVIYQNAKASIRFVFTLANKTKNNFSPKVQSI